MKKSFLLAATFFAFAALQSCSKCGHCHYETTSGSVTQKQDGSIYCGNDANESGSYRKQAELACKEWAANQTPVTGVSYSSTWVTDK